MGFLSDLFKGITGAIGDVIGWLVGIEEPNIDDQSRGALVNKQSNIEPIPVIYGQRKVGGTRVFVSTGGAKKNEYLYIALALCEGEVEEIGDVYINDVLSTDSKYSGLVSITKYLGTDAQTYSTLLAEADDTWGSNHRLRGVAYLAMRFKYDPDVFSSIPEVQAVVKGRKVYDPETTTTVWSDNPALCLRDYLTNARYGKGLSSALIDDTSFIAAKAFCNTTVTSSTAGAGTQKIFECNAVIDTDKNLFDNVRILLRGMRGLMPYSNGIYSLIIDKSESSSFDLTPDNITSDLTVASAGKSKKYNKVTVKFTNPEANWQSDTVFWPPAGSTEETTFLSEDNNQELSTEITLPTITNYYSARDIARVACLTSRASDLSVKVTATSEALVIAAGDVVRLEQPSMGWVDDGVTDARQLFRVVGIQLVNTGEVKLTLQKYDSTIYTWDEGAEEPPTQSTTLPNPFAVEPPSGLSIEETTIVADDGTLLPSLRVTWTASNDAFVDRYEVQWQRGEAIEDYGSVGDEFTISEDWQSITVAADFEFNYGSIDEAVVTGEPNYNSAFTSTLQYVIQGVTPSANYNIRVRAFNTLGAKSSFVGTSSQPEGDTDPPGIPASLAAAGGLRQIALSWQIPTDPDYSHVEVWEANVNNFATATRIAIATGDNYIRASLGYDVTRYYWVKSVDYSGNVSDESDGASATTIFVDSDAFSEEVNNLFSEAGAYGIEPVSSLPETGDFDGQIKYDTTANKLYRWDASAGEWTDDIFSITTGSVDLASFAAGIEPVGIVSSLPSPTGYTGAQVVFNTTDNKLYRYTGSAWIASVPAADVEGALAAANFPSNLRPIEIVATLPSTGNFEGRQAYLTSDNKLYRYDGTQWTAKINTVDLEGTITSLQIANDAVTNAKIAVDAIQGDVIAAGAITADKILNGAISELKLADDAVTTAKLAVDSVTADIVAANAITSESILNGAISELKLADDAVTTAKLATSAVTADIIATNSISATKIQDNAIETAKISAGAITTAKISAGAVTADTIAANAVTTAKINAGAVTADTIAASAITTAKIAAGAITAVEIAANTITSGKIAAGAITAETIASNAVTAVKINANAVTSDKITADAITTAKIAAGAVTAAEIAANTITAAKIAAGTITATEIATNAITSAKILANAVTSDKITAGSITTDKLAADVITANEIATGAVTADAISAGAIEAGAIAAGAISSAKIAAGAITADKIASGAITTAKLAADSVTAGVIAAGAVSTSELAANAVVASKIAAGTITTDKIAAGTIQGDRIAANTITGGLIAAAGIITTAAQIEDAVITNAKIQNLAITTAKIADLSVDTLKIADQAVTLPLSSQTVDALTLTTNQLWNTVQSLTIAATGDPVKIAFSIILDNESGSQRFCHVRLRKNASTILLDTSSFANDGIRIYDAEANIISYVYDDTSGDSGSQTYYVDVRRNGTWTGTFRVRYRVLTAVVLKK
jgi:hypothetical protein